MLCVGGRQIAPTSLSPPTSVMSTPSHTNIPSSTFLSIFDAASNEYEKKTGQDLRTHPFADQIDSCDSADAILAVFQKQVDALNQARKSHQMLMKWLNPTVNLLFVFSATLGEGISLTFSPAKVIFTGIGVLLQAAKDAAASHDILIDIFDRIQGFLIRVKIYSGITLTTEMTAMLGKIMSEVLCILALSMKEIKRGRIKTFLNKLVGRKEIEDALRRLDNLTQEETRVAVAKSLEAVDKLNRNQSRADLRRWLSSPDPSINHNIACSAHHDGTATWFIDGSSFNEWKSSGSLLWLHGKPGSGKSILCSAIVESIKEMCKAGLASMCYYYFDFKDASKRDVRGLLISLLDQLCDQSDHSWGVLSQLYATHRDGAEQPSELELIECLGEMLNVQGQPPIYIIVDAVDECPNAPCTSSPREKVVNLMERLIKLRLSNVRILATSRPEHDIQPVLESLASHQICLHDQSGQKNDIISYVGLFVNSHKATRRWRAEDKTLIIRMLSERANGMFRWVVCQLDRLCQCFPSSIRDILDDLPATLDETYERILLEIPKEKWKHAHRLLQCLFVSVRPLRVEELAEVLAVRFDTEKMPDLITSWREEDPEDAVLSACSSLIAVVNAEDSWVVQFSHFSVKEFLTSNRLADAQDGSVSRYHIPPEPAHKIMAQACLGTLLQLGDGIDINGLKNYPLAFYAAQNWVDHARFGDVSSWIREGMEQLFDSTKPHLSAWIWIHKVDEGRKKLSIMDLAECPSQPDATPLYYAAACGFRDLAEQLISMHPQDVNARGGYYEFPLHVASRWRHREVIRLLLRHGADINAKGDDNKGTALYRISRDGDVEIMDLLLKNGADVNAGLLDNDSPLCEASNDGHLKAVQLLVEHGADVNVHGYQGWTPLYQAAIIDALEVIRFLLHHGADVDARDDANWTTLHRASDDGRLEVAQLLLEHGADVNAQDEDQFTPLHRASRSKHLGIAGLLLEHGADVNAQDEGQTTPLHLVGDQGLKIARLLLEHGADMHARDKSNKTPFQVMSERGDHESAQLLLEHGAKEE